MSLLRLKLFIFLVCTVFISCQPSKPLSNHLSWTITANGSKQFIYRLPLEREKYGIRDFRFESRFSNEVLNNLAEIEKKIVKRIRKAKICKTFFIYDRQYKDGAYILSGECNESYQ